MTASYNYLENNRLPVRRASDADVVGSGMGEANSIWQAANREA